MKVWASPSLLLHLCFAGRTLAGVCCAGICCRPPQTEQGETYGPASPLLTCRTAPVAPALSP